MTFALGKSPLIAEFPTIKRARATPSGWFLIMEKRQYSWSDLPLMYRPNIVPTYTLLELDYLSKHLSTLLGYLKLTHLISVHSSSCFP